MSAISISNSVDWVNREKREAEYMRLVGKYAGDELRLFPEMFAHFVGELEVRQRTDGPFDVLGKLFHELELHNKYRGQFFTPQHVCDMMALMSLDENDSTIAKKGYIKMAEPCCGSGAMVLGFAKAMTKNGYDYNRQMLVEARDVDLKCVHMCYLQLSLYGIPAVIIHGNTLLFEQISRWHTPVYMLDGWPMREALDRIMNLTTTEKPPPDGVKFYFEFKDEVSAITLPSANQLNIFEEVTA